MISKLKIIWRVDILEVEAIPAKVGPAEVDLQSVRISIEEDSTF
jgi:hypothetical protein